jgi:NitT/TauT family transport system ATP-binding protein
MSYIQIDRLWKHYGETPVLEHIHTDVQRGAFVTLVGTSGCGKSTFLKMLLGVEQPTHGHILLEGEAIRAEPDADRGIVFQRYSVFPHLNVRDNILIALEFRASRLSARLFGTARRQALGQVNDMIEHVGLGHAATRYPHELSGGMQQRLAIAQALIAKPRILLLDEPFGALDPGIRKDMHSLVRALWRDEGLTIFMVTHDLKEAFSLGTRLWVFDKTRHDPHAPHRYGSTITYDLDLSDNTLKLDNKALSLEISQTVLHQSIEPDPTDLHHAS